MSVDAMDLVRRFYDAVNRSDAAAVAALYHPACIVEYVFTDDAQVHEGLAEVRARWAAEFARFAGAGPGGRRVEVDRIAGMETGWGWVRADWRRALREAGGPERRGAGYSHFWIEDDLIRRHRSVILDAGPVSEAAPAPADRDRPAPTKPVVGVGAVILTEDRHVVLVKRRHEPLAGQWSLPGGRLELGETLEAGTAREIREETGLVVDVGPVVEVFDRILVDETGRVRYHFVLVDYLCRPRGGVLCAGSDVDAVMLADPAALAEHRITEKAAAVIQRAVGMSQAGPQSPVPPFSQSAGNM